MTATPSDEVKQVKARIAGLKRRTAFVDWHRSREFAAEVLDLLDEIRASTGDAKTGVELTIAFLKTDQATLERCDDSSGTIGDVYRHDAVGQFVEYAQEYGDKKRLYKLILKLLEQDPYTIRGEVLESAASFLPPELLRAMAEHYWDMAGARGREEPYFNSDLEYTSILARQLNDTALFERAMLAKFPKNPDVACLDIAAMHLNTGNPQTALKWLEKTSPGRSREHVRRDLLFTAYRQLGDTARAGEIAWLIFRDHRNTDTLGKLLDTIGPDRRNEVLRDEARLILGSKGLDYIDAKFLIDVGDDASAAEYILKRARKLDGKLYMHLVPLARAMEDHRHWLAASVIYRALLESILERANSKYYYHGVRYLRKLSALAAKVGDWRGIMPHEDYRRRIGKAHERKRSFWERYGDTPDGTA